MRQQPAAKVHSVRSVEVQLGTWESSPSASAPPKGTLTDNERRNAGAARTQGAFN